MLSIIALIWLIGAWFPAQSILAKFLAGDKKIIALLAVFLPIFILGPLANVFTAWFKLNDLSIYLSFAISLVGLWAVNRFLIKPEKVPELAKVGQAYACYDFPKLLFWLFGLLIVGGYYFIWQSVADSALISPWDVLSAWQLVIVMAEVAIIILAIYARRVPAVATLMMIVAVSLLIHSYLLVYQNGFGGDRFRHLASEQRILSGLEYQPTLLADNIWFSSFGPLQYPQALTDSAKLSYGAMWSLEAIVAKVSGWPVFEINRYFLPLLWSIFLTLIIYAGAYLLKPDRQFALLSALLANSFYLFQYYGAQGLPASYGLLWLAFYSLGLLAYLRAPSRLKFWLLFSGLILMYFNYSLAFLLAGIGLLLAVALVKKKILAYPLAGSAILLLIYLDYLSSPILAFSWSKILPSWSFASLLDFQALNRLVPLIGEWHLSALLLMIGAVIIIALAILRIYRRQDSAWLFISLMAQIILTAYFLSYWFLNGEHTLSRRLALFAVLFLICIFADIAHKAIIGRKSLIAVSIIIILLSATAYYSGPALNVAVTSADVARAEKIWPTVRNNPDVCVIEPLPVILALEYVSAKEFQETINDRNCQP